MLESNRHALIIGNSRYQDKTLRELAAPELDAQALERVLENPDISNFKAQTLLNQKNDPLRRAIEKFFARSLPDDTLLFYFSGHGIADDLGELYLAVTDTERGYWDSTAIPASFIRQLIERKCRADRKIVILDCCHSGAVTGDMLAKGETFNIGPQFGKGIVFLAASTALQYALEGAEVKELRKSAQSLFTHFLVQGLATGDAARGNNPFISVNDLFRYAEAQMRQARVGQTPQITAIEQQGDIIIARSVRPQPLPERISTSLESNKQSSLLEAISDLKELARGKDQKLAKRAIEELIRLSRIKDKIEVQASARAALLELDELPASVEQKVSSVINTLSHVVLEALRKKLQWFTAFIGITLILWVISHDLSLFGGVLTGALVLTLLLGSVVFLLASVIEWVMGADNSAQLESRGILALVAVVSFAGYIIFQTTTINTVVNTIHLMSPSTVTEMPIKSPDATSTAPAVSTSTKTSWSKGAEDFFAIKKFDDALRVFIIVFGILGALAGGLGASHRPGFGFILGGIIGVIVGVLMGSIAGLAKEIGNNIHPLF